MKHDPDIVLPVILVTSALTFGMRYLPLVMMRGVRLRTGLDRVLRSLPIGILAALIAQAIFLRNGALDPGIANHYLHGTVVLLAIAAFTRNLAAIIFGGIATVGVLQYLYG